LHTAALLNHVCRFVRGSVERRRPGKGDVASGRVRLGMHRPGGGCGGTPDMCSDPAHVVPAEQALDLLAMGQRHAATHDAGRCRVADRIAIAGHR
jgi:hypothetical protein